MVAASKAPPAFMSTESVQSLIDRLPAEKRAKVRWAPTELKAALLSFVQGAQTAEALKALVEQVVEAFAQVFERDALEALIETEEFASSVEAGFNQDLEVLSQRLSPTDFALAAWTSQSWIGFIRSAVREMVKAPVEEVRRVLAKQQPIPFDAPLHPTRVQALIMAAVEGARNNVDAERISLAIRQSFDDMSAQVAFAKTVGMPFTAFEKESSDARRARMDGYAEMLRAELDDDDLAALESSRFRSLR
ncbi:MAG TPA: hypothetical protein VGM90_33370 [Kofleriaceae bacterium]